MGGESYTYRSADVLVNELGSMDFDESFTATSVKELGSIDLGGGLEAIGSNISDVWFRRLESVKLDTRDSFDGCLEDCAARQSGKQNV